MTRPLSGGQLGVGGGPLTLGGDLSGTTDAAKVINVGLENIVTDYASFVAADNVSSAAGVHTVNGRILGSGVMTLPAGESIVYSETGFMASNGHEHWTIVGDFDGPLVSGAVVMSFIDTQNDSLGANSFCVEVTSTLGRLVQMDYSGTNGLRGIHLANVTGIFLSRFAGSNSPTAEVAYLISGITGVIVLDVPAAVLGVPPAVFVEIDGSAVISGLIQLSSSAVISSGTQSAVAVSDAAVFGPGAFLQVTGGGASGPQNNFFRQGPNDRTPDDLVIQVNGVAGTPNWSANQDVSRFDDVIFMTVVLDPNPLVSVPVPYSSGVAPELEITDSVRFSLYKKPGDPTVWWQQYEGATPGVRALAYWSLRSERSGGGGRMTASVERNPALALASVQAEVLTVFTDFTEAAGNLALDDVPLTPAAIAVGDANYYGSPAKFGTLRIDVSQKGVGTYTMVWEFWDGVAVDWVPATGLVDGTAGLTADPGRHDVDHTPETDWAATAIGLDPTPLFYLRSRLTVATSITTQPRATEIISYSGFAPIASTVDGLDNSALRQNVNSQGDQKINPGDRFNQALTSTTGAQTVLIFGNKQFVKVNA